jgi:hypothetical protein
MQHHLKTTIFAWSVVCMLASTSASALTLGRLRGSVLLGKELDVSVNVQFAADEDGSANCFDADVAYGDIPLERSRIAVQVQPGGQPNNQLVRITSSLPVNDAVVTLKLKAACGLKAMRRYVLLSDVISDTQAPVAESVPTRSSVPTRAQPAGAQPVSTASTNESATSAARSNLAPVAKKAPLSRPKRITQANAPAKDSAALAGKSLNSAAMEELQRRVDEIEKAQSGTSNSEQLLKNAALSKALEADIESLRIATARNQSNLQAMATTLEGSTPQGYGRVLVYLLSALLVACLAALAYIVTRRRNAGPASAPWWSGGEDRAVTVARSHTTARAPLSPVGGVADGIANVAHSAAVGTVAGATAPASIQSQPVDFDADTTRSTVVMDVRPVKMPAVTAQPIAPRALHQDFANSNTAAIKTINTKEMLDVRQQAEFFMALGQHDEAVRLLESNIQDSADANPLIFLDLLKILHTLSRRDEFERYREEFNLQFTGRVLDFANYHTEGNGLDAYEEICQQIVVLWPSEYTIDYIEQCLVRTPEDDPEQGIDLDAFKDLLLLYGVLRRLDQTDEAYLPFSTSRIANMPSGVAKNGTGDASAAGASLPPLPVIDPDSQAADIDLDINLDVDLDIDLDVSKEMVKSDKKTDNLIDFDMSGFVTPKSDKPAKP